MEGGCRINRRKGTVALDAVDFEKGGEKQGRVLNDVMNEHQYSIIKVGALTLNFHRLCHCLKIPPIFVAALLGTIAVFRGRSAMYPSLQD
jgi:hypothetical protein